MAYSWLVTKTTLLWLLAGLLVTTSGCPTSKRRIFVPDAPTNGDKTARTRFQEARALFKRDNEKATAEFEKIAAQYANDPIAPWAMLYAGISAYRAGDYTKAIANLRKLNGQAHANMKVLRRGKLFLGLAFNYEGRHADAVAHLRDGASAIENDGERTEWQAAMAESHSRGVRPVASLTYYDAWHKSGRPAEQAYILSRLQAIVAKLSSADALQSYDVVKPVKTPAGAVLAHRVANDLDAAGNPSGATAIRNQAKALRAKLGLPSATAAGKADVNMLGAVLPLTGRRSRRGDLAMRGLALAAGTFRDSAKLSAGPFTLSVRDSQSKLKPAVGGAEALATSGVIAMVGPIHGGSVDAVSVKATALGVPLLSLNPRSELRKTGQSPFVFHLMLSAEERAKALARYASNKGVQKFAVLAPKSGYGRAVGKAFRDEVTRLGGTVTIEASYDRRATSFTKVIRTLKAKPWGAVFIPDQARRLELVAPALTAAGLISSTVRKKRRRSRRGTRRFLLLSTAEFLAPRYLASSGRYSRGAVFAPGFYPDRFDSTISDFVDRYEQSFNRLPTALDAYGFDAALVVRAAINSGAKSRAQLSQALMKSRVRALTGTVRFSAQRRRADAGLLYQVRRKSGRYQIRAMRN